MTMRVKVVLAIKEPEEPKLDFCDTARDTLAWEYASSSGPTIYEMVLPICNREAAISVDSAEWKFVSVLVVIQYFLALLFGTFAGSSAAFKLPLNSLIISVSYWVISPVNKCPFGIKISACHTIETVLSAVH